jgi:hypothetical protein
LVTTSKPIREAGSSLTTPGKLVTESDGFTMNQTQPHAADNQEGTIMTRSIAPLALATLLMVGACSTSTPAPSTPNAPAPSSSTSAATPSTSSAPPAGDKQVVTVSTCKIGDFGLAESELKIQNATGDSKSFLITVSMNGADGNRLVELNAAANSVAAGQTATVKAIGSATGLDKNTKVDCKVADVKSF